MDANEVTGADVGDLIDMIEAGQGDTPVTIQREQHVNVAATLPNGQEVITTQARQPRGQAGVQRRGPMAAPPQQRQVQAPQEEQVQVQEQVHEPSQGAKPKLSHDDPNHPRNLDPQGYINHLHTKLGTQANEQGDLKQSVKLLTELVEKQNEEPDITDGMDALERFGRAVDPEYEDYKEDASHKKVLQIVQNGLTILAQAQAADQAAREQTAFAATALYSEKAIQVVAKDKPWISSLNAQEQQEAMKGLGVPVPKGNSSASLSVDQARYTEVNNSSTVSDFNPTKPKNKAEELNALVMGGKSNSAEAQVLFEGLLDDMNLGVQRR